MDAGDIGGALTRKLGPLPVWVWGVSAGLGISGVRWYMSRDDPKDLPADATDTAAAEGAAGGSGGGAAGVSLPLPNPGAWGGPAPDGVTTPSTSDIPPVTNTEWRAKAEREVVRNTGLATVVVGAALDKYLSGAAVDANEEYIIGRARALAGYPPEGAPAISRAQTQAPGGTVETPSGPVAGTVNPPLYNVEVWGKIVNTGGMQQDPAGTLWERHYGVTAATVKSVQDKYAALNVPGGHTTYNVVVTPA